MLVAVALPSGPAEGQTCAPLDNGHLADVFYQGTAIVWSPVVEYQEMVLTISGPCEEITRVFGPKDQVYFDLRDIQRVTDGRYTWQLRRVSPVDPDVQKDLQASRGTGEEDALWWSYFQAGKIPAGPYVESASFTVFRGEIIDPSSGEETQKQATLSGKATAGLLGGAAASVAGYDATASQLSEEGGNRLATKDFVIVDDLIVDGSACIGFDCVNGESFGFDTIRIKENNLRIQFTDTSVAASFPRNNWQIRANSSANGGASYLGFIDQGSSGSGETGDLVFAVEANAPTNALYVDDGGRVGFGTSTPSVELHSVDGDTPTLRLAQDGSSGFAPQTWDIAGNETSFFIRDATNGSTLPFRIRPGASSNALVIDGDNDIGVGILSPDTRLHVRATDGLAAIKVEEQNGTTSQRIMLNLINNGAPQTEMTNSDNNITWRFGHNNTGDFVINDTADLGTAEMRITPAGEVYVNGGVVHPDYVFKPDYELMPLSELERFVQQNRHLPNVQSAGNREQEGGVNITKLPLQLLEKVEELTLYTLQQEKRIDELSQQNVELSRQNAEFAELLEELRAALGR